MGKVWKICEKNSVEKICAKEYREKSVENVWKTIPLENYGTIMKKIVWKRIAWENVENNNTWGKCERTKPC